MPIGGSGVRSVEDPALLDHLVEHQVPLGICPTSNTRTGVVTSWAEHPVVELIERGAWVTISSDDPMYFECSVAGDLRQVAAMTTSWAAIDWDDAARKGVDPDASPTSNVGHLADLGSEVIPRALGSLANRYLGRPYRRVEDGRSVASLTTAAQIHGEIRRLLARIGTCSPCTHYRAFVPTTGAWHATATSGAQADP